MHNNEVVSEKVKKTSSLEAKENKINETKGSADNSNKQ